MDIIKISLLGVCGVMLGFLMKNALPAYASLITMAVGLMILGLAVGKVRVLFQTIETIRQSLPVDGGFVTVLLKMVGITYIGQFSSAICKDAGYEVIGSQIELFCRLSVMVLSMPVLLALLETIQEFLA